MLHRRVIPRILSVAILLAPAALRAQLSPVGSWRGYWARGTDTLAVTMKILPGDQARHYRASFSSERLRVEGIPFASAELRGCCALHMELRGDATSTIFDGTLERDRIRGALAEAGQVGSFALRRVGRRASSPREEQIEFRNGEVRLQGTLLLPSAPPPFPAVVMAHGSGPEGRWANRFLGRRFADAGIAALIFDKRGVGQSSGDWRAVGFEELAGDVAAAVALLRARRDIRGDRIGLYGHSQGGTLLPLVAEAAPGVAFLIASAASGVPMDSAERFSLRNSIGVAALPPAQAARASEYVDALVGVAYRGEPRERLDSLARMVSGEPWFFPLPEPGNSYWSFSRRVADYDPPAHWRHVDAPVLVVFGAADQRVPAAASIAAIRAALAAGHHPPLTVCVYPGADHTLRVHPPGDVWPRNAPHYLEDVISWTQRAAAAGPRLPLRPLSDACTTAVGAGRPNQGLQPRRGSR